MIEDDVIIQRGLEDRTVQLNTKYEGLNLDDLDNFRSDATIQQWEGEDFWSRLKSHPFIHISMNMFLLQLLFFWRRKLWILTCSRCRKVDVKQIFPLTATSRIP